MSLNKRFKKKKNAHLSESQMQPSKEPHLAREPWFPDPCVRLTGTSGFGDGAQVTMCRGFLEARAKSKIFST